MNLLTVQHYPEFAYWSSTILECPNFRKRRNVCNYGGGSIEPRGHTLDTTVGEGVASGYYVGFPSLRGGFPTCSNSLSFQYLVR